MKYIILFLGILVIGLIAKSRDLLETGGYGGGVGCLAVMFIELIWIVLWLVVFYVFDVNLPKITI